MKFTKPEQPMMKYPSEDEPYVRRLGAALLVHWAELPDELRQKLLADAVTVWDREFHIPQLAKKLDIFLKRQLSLLSQRKAEKVTPPSGS